jgi:hypothetical protein
MKAALYFYLEKGLVDPLKKYGGGSPARGPPKIASI